MDEEIEVAVANVLERLGYRNVEHNCGTVWYDDANGQTWAISAIQCEE